MAKSNSKDKNKPQINEEELRVLNNIIASHKRLLTAIGKL